MNVALLPLFEPCEISTGAPNPKASGGSQPKADLGLLVTLTSMAKLIFGLQQSLDGYVDYLEIRPGRALFRHFVESRARPSRHCVWSPNVRDHALLGRRPARVGRGGTRLRGGVAKATEVGRVALVEVSRPQRHAGPE